jgi:hypothetical protein
MILNRLELDVMQANELQEAAELASKYLIPAVVVHPGLSGDAIRARGRAKARFKIITPVDWAKGTEFSTNKFRGLSTDAIEADGFEILLTSGVDSGSTKREAMELTKFIKDHLSETTEVRFVLGVFNRSDEEIDSLLSGLVGVRTPSLIRTDTQLKLQVSRANLEAHLATIEKIRKHIRAPIKVSGNVGSARMMGSIPDMHRLAVSVTQARAIIKEIQQQPEQLRNMLDDEADEFDDAEE